MGSAANKKSIRRWLSSVSIGQPDASSRVSETFSSLSSSPTWTLNSSVRPSLQTRSSLPTRKNKEKRTEKQTIPPVFIAIPFFYEPIALLLLLLLLHRPKKERTKERRVREDRLGSDPYCSFFFLSLIISDGRRQRRQQQGRQRHVHTTTSSSELASRQQSSAFVHDHESVSYYCHYVSYCCCTVFDLWFTAPLMGEEGRGQRLSWQSNAYLRNTKCKASRTLEASMQR